MSIVRSQIRIIHTDVNLILLLQHLQTLQTSQRNMLTIEFGAKVLHVFYIFYSLVPTNKGKFTRTKLVKQNNKAQTKHI